ncbi:hypothetical protein WJ0W_001456 [Paenibacillus melissococcoides]|uniref:Uncharacterized protein n=1 Tax=Paenibacillus melissococcoides TaxID=2912268 RepID=A0ABN8TZK8_9BACL|nr:hypothetical protein WJ0W_001456 [Paenibacillus melissococcoides]
MGKKSNQRARFFHDFGLIGEAVQKNAVTPWIRGLMNDYMEGTFPISSREDMDGTDE